MHVANRLMDHIEGTNEVGTNEVGPHFRILVANVRPFDQSAGGMNEKIDISERVGGFRKSRGYRVRVADVGFQCQPLAADGFDCGYDLFSFLPARFVETATEAPRLANSRAMARPTPRLPPVTKVARARKFAHTCSPYARSRNYCMRLIGGQRVQNLIPQCGIKARLTIWLV